MKFRLFVPSGCQKCVFTLQINSHVLLQLTPCFPPGRDFRDRCPLIKMARKKLTDIFTHISTLRHLRRWNFSLTAFQPPLDLLSGGITEFSTYFSGASPAEVP